MRVLLDVQDGLDFMGASGPEGPSNLMDSWGSGGGGGFITRQREAQHRMIPWEQNNSRKEDLFKGFGEKGERMLIAQKVVQNNDLGDHSMIPDPSKTFLPQNK